ncbi:MAG TPA: GNAT family N-acetyltransferase [Pyrinomonadaceae bacterium]|jgi:RimJ/RimL family protein N-acetyltransferase|nr:GNAT family N-acetyltransferase [Pyrinomonadaceae bacterium]
MTTLQTERLLLRRLTVDDAEFILALLNEPSFLRYIGDKKVRNLDDARRYLLNGPIASYEQHGLGLCLVELLESQTPIGMCGLLKRAELPEPDIGFALMPDFWNKGFAFEAATAVLNDARERLKLQRILAITSLDNDASINLLQRLGFRFEGVIKLSADGEPVKLFTRDHATNKS